MALAAMRPTATSERTSSCAGCQALEARIAALEARLTPGPRDAADVVLLHVLAVMPPAGASFTAAGVWRRRMVDPELFDALVAADIDNPRQLGKLLKRLAGRAVDGVRVERIGVNREGAVLRVWRE